MCTLGLVTNRDLLTTLQAMRLTETYSLILTISVPPLPRALRDTVVSKIRNDCGKQYQIVFSKMHYLPCLELLDILLMSLFSLRPAPDKFFVGCVAMNSSLLFIGRNVLPLSTVKHQ